MVMKNNYMTKLIFTFFITLLFVSCTKETTNKEINMNNNLRFRDLNNNYYELKDYAKQGKAILLFGFNIWCRFGDYELVHVKKIDSLYSDKIKVFGLDCIDSTEKFGSISDMGKIGFPVSKRFWNNNFDRLVFIDSMYVVPKIVLLDKYLNVIYVQNRYLPYTIDSVMTAYNNSINKTEKKANPLTDITDKCVLKAIYSNSKFCIFKYNYRGKVITDQAKYIKFEDSIRCPGSVPDTVHLFNNIDFEKYTLIAIGTHSVTNATHYTRSVFKDEVSKKIVYKIIVTDLGRLDVIMDTWNFAFIPKLQAGYTVEFQVDFLGQRCGINF
jgi:hypothetical protein